MSFQEQAEKLTRSIGPGKPKAMAFAGLVITVIILCFMAAFFFLQPSNDEFVLEAATENSDEANSENIKSSQDDVDELEKIVVHVGGSVKNPGVYELTLGDRVERAIEAAGGTSEGALLDALNLARILQDGEQILVPNEKDYETNGFSSSNVEGTGGGVVAGKLTSILLMLRS